MPYNMQGGCAEWWFFSIVLKPLLCALPLWCRFMQALRVYHDTHKRWPALGNALKYAIAHLVVLFGVLHNPLWNQRVGEVEDQVGPSSPHPSSLHPSSLHTSSPHPSSLHPSSLYPSSPHPSSLHPSSPQPSSPQLSCVGRAGLGFGLPRAPRVGVCIRDLDALHFRVGRADRLEARRPQPRRAARAAHVQPPEVVRPRRHRLSPWPPPTPDPNSRPNPQPSTLAPPPPSPQAGTTSPSALTSCSGSAGHSRWCRARSPWATC